MKIRGKLIVRNTAYNLLGFASEFVVAIVTYPLIVRGLGVDRFGVFTLVLVAVSYFGLLDFGLGQAISKYVAQAVARAQTDSVRPTVVLAVCFAAGVGAIGALVLIALTPMLVRNALHLPTALVGDAERAFYYAALLIVLIVIANTLRGVLEAYQRFDIINAVKMSGDLFVSALTAVAVVAFHARIQALVLLLVVKNIGVILAYARAARRLVPKNGIRISEALQTGAALFRYGGWIALQNGTVSLLLYLDRFLVAAMMTVTAVGYYAVPQGIVNRALVIPSSLMAVLFPAMSFLHASDPGELRRWCAQAFKYLTVAMGTICAALIVFGREILLLWLGPEFVRSTVVLQVVSVGAFLGSLAWLAAAFLQAIGDARYVTLAHVVQVPPYIVGAWFLIKVGGIEGAAIAWTLRIAASAIVTYTASWRHDVFSIRALVGNRSLGFLGLLAGTSLISMIAKALGPPPIGILGSGMIFAMGVSSAIWAYALDVQERAQLRGLIRAVYPKPRARRTSAY